MERDESTKGSFTTGEGTQARAEPRRRAPGSPPGSIGRYVVKEELGRGGMGVVYRAHDPELERDVAVKVVRGEANAQQRAALAHEARALARLAHPNVLTVLDVGELAGGVFITMELVEGMTLREMLRATDHSWSDILALWRRAGEGLAAAHRARIVHGDFKPHNVMVGRDGRVRVLDFGLARVMTESDSRTPLSTLTSGQADRSRATHHLRRPVGTPVYMAPEQWAGDPPDAHSDQFAFCVAVWQSLWRVHPFGEGTQVEVGARVVAGERRRPPAKPRVPRRVRTALERGLRVDPDQRWPDMDALLAAISARPRRRAWAVLVGALALAVAWFSPEAARDAMKARDEQRATEAHERCLQAVAEQDHPWPAAREESRRGLLETGKGYARTTAERVDAALDRHVAAWKLAHRNVCAAEHTAHELSSEQAEEARVCLAENAQQVAELAERWAAASSTDLEGAVPDAVALPAPDDCLDPRSLKARTIIATLPEEDAELLRSLASATVFGAHRWRGPDGDPASRRARWERGYLLATEHALDDLAAAAALMLAVPASGHRTSDAPRQWLKRSRAAVARLPPNSPLRDRAEVVFAEIAADQGNPEDALVHYRVALQRVEERLGSDHPVVGRLLNNMANAARYAGDLQTEAALRARAIEILAAGLGSDHPHVWFARVAEASKRAETADGAQRRRIVSVFEEAVARFEDAYGPDATVVARTLDNLSELVLPDDPQRAIALAERTLEVWREGTSASRIRTARARSNIGKAQAVMGRWEAAVASQRDALADLEADVGPSDPDTHEVLARLGHALLGAGDHAEAVRALQRALATLPSATPPADHAWLLQQLARAHKGAGQPAEAAATATQARDLYATAGMVERLEKLDQWRRAQRLRWELPDRVH